MILLLTGAGISQESGIATFRDSNGLWEKEKVEDVATPEGFKRDPERVNRFYNGLRAHLLGGTVSPNPAHYALAKLEAEASEQIILVTQNIDNLHKRTGSKEVLHMHGELLKAYCPVCECPMYWDRDITHHDRCAVCGRVGTLRPHIVWFGEMPLCMEEIESALRYCRLFVSIGTSSVVQPAAGFAARAKKNGTRIIELNLEKALPDDTVDEGYYGKASEIVPAWVESVLGTGARIGLHN